VSGVYDGQEIGSICNEKVKSWVSPLTAAHVTDEGCNRRATGQLCLNDAVIDSLSFAVLMIRSHDVDLLHE
jgi:hypothetical protein